MFLFVATDVESSLFVATDAEIPLVVIQLINLKVMNRLAAITLVCKIFTRSRHIKGVGDHQLHPELDHTYFGLFCLFKFEHATLRVLDIT